MRSVLGLLSSPENRKNRSGFSVCSAGFLAALLLAGTLHAQTTQSPEALVKEAESFQQAGKLDEAIKDYRLFLAQVPDVVPVRSNLGAALAAAGRYEEAIVEYKKALRLQPLPQVRLNLALAYYKAVQLNEAVHDAPVASFRRLGKSPNSSITSGLLLSLRGIQEGGDTPRAARNRSSERSGVDLPVRDVADARWAGA